MFGNMLGTEALLVLVPTFFVAYTVFAMVGFGSTLISAPIAGHVVPLPVLIPAQALLDVVAATGSTVKLYRQVHRVEFTRILLGMIVGLGVGAYILFTVPVQALMVVLGAFVVLYAIRGMRPQPPQPPIPASRACLYGFLGGVLTALFGAGAWLYAIYLSRRLDDPQAIRATQITLIGVGAISRVCVYALAGQYADWHVVALSLASFPSMLLGVYVGHRLAHRLNRARFLRALYVVLLITGSALFMRGLAILV